MGTNYYWRTPKCGHCGRSDADKHIGKSSCGWVFSLHVYPDGGIKDLDDWLRIWLGGEGEIVDEYGKEASVYEMLRIIVGRHGAKDKDAPHSCGCNVYRGPDGLLRCYVGTNLVVGQGAGTWELVDGEFS